MKGYAKVAVAILLLGLVAGGELIGCLAGSRGMRGVGQSSGVLLPYLSTG